MRLESEAAEDRLAPYARRSARALRQLPLAAEGRAFDYRTEFQRDRDRLIHSRAFRRLRDKADVRLAPDDDPGRSRLTHSLEVGQLGRTIARVLRLNEDLVEAIGLGHDLGQPPLGRAGEETLDALLTGVAPLPGLTARSLAPVGGFDVASQSLRVVDLLEKRYDHQGINLTDDVRAGLWKQHDPARASGYPDQKDDGLEAGAPASAEAQVIRLACRITSVTESLDDLLRARPVALERVERLSLVKELLRKLGARYPRAGGHFMRLNMLHRGTTHLLVTSGIRQSSSTLSRWAEREKITDSKRFHDRRGALPPRAIGLPPRVGAMLAELETHVESERAGSRAMALHRQRARRLLEGLFRGYYEDPEILDDYVLIRFRELEKVRYLRDIPTADREGEVARRYRGSAQLVRLIADHTAGMTDTYAGKEFRRLCTEG